MILHRALVANFIDIREQLGLRAAIVKKNTVPVPALWQRMVEARECDELLILPDGDILLGTIDLRSKVKSVIGGALTGHGVYGLFPNYSTLYKVDARSGAILWKYERAGEMGSAVHRFVDVSDDALVIQQGNEKKEYLLQLDLANGKEQWRQEIESGAQCRRIGDNILVFHLSGKEVLSCTCYSLPNRTQVYAKTLGNVSDNYLLTEFGTGKIAVTDDTACLLIDAATGDMVERTEAVTAFVNIYATPAFLLLVSGNGDCVMLDGEGRELWNIRIGLPPLLCDEWEDNVYWITQGEGVTSLSAIDKSSGERRWRKTKNTGYSRRETWCN